MESRNQRKGKEIRSIIDRAQRNERIMLNFYTVLHIKTKVTPTFDFSFFFIVTTILELSISSALSRDVCGLLFHIHSMLFYNTEQFLRDESRMGFCFLVVILITKKFHFLTYCRLSVDGFTSDFVLPARCRFMR